MKKKKTDSKPYREERNEKSFPIVGIGASAGGLEALEGLFSHMASDSNIAFVIIQHLDPKHKSIMSSLLQKYTEMIVLQIEDGMKIEPNTVYLNPPNRNVAIMNRTLHLIEPVETHRINLPIDSFFRSFSEDQGEKAICIILSGTGTDGSLGLKAIKGAGGMAMVQEEKQAKYDGMPRSAIDTGLVDYILPVERMSEALIKYVKHPYIEGTKKVVTAEQQFWNSVQKIFMLIRSSTGHDFSDYKKNTIRRRIERRMAVHQVDKIEDYVRYLQQTPAEVDTLFKELLITVTNFFRDPNAFDVLEEKVIPVLLEHKPPEAPVRIWVPGCATGEEAYSIAMLLVEIMERLNKHFNVQVFATDIDAEAIEYGRRAVYPDSIAADVSSERLKRFFIKDDSTYKIKKQIREMVVFATQNLIKDPTFSKLDLVSCRNVLIYMDSVLQKRILPLFHYTLHQDGILFLGTSESIGEFTDLFSPIDTKWKIFKRKGAILEKPLIPPSIPAEIERIEEKKILADTNIRELAERVILENYAPPCVLINEKYEIIYFYGKTDRYLSPPMGEPSFNILKMASEELRYKLSTSLHKAVKQKKTVFSEGLTIKHNDDFLNIDLVVRPLTEISRQDLLMVIFKDRSLPYKFFQKKGKTPKEKEEDPRIAALEQELQSSKQYLRTTIEELETSNEELKSTNEELQSTNEELQSTNEELETSKEELQSTNEELETVNSELRNKVDELSRVNSDLNNLLTSTEIGTIFLDTNLRVKLFTQSVTRIFNLIQADIGRPISDITSKITYENLYNNAKDVLNTLNQKEAEIQSIGGEWFTMQILPYRTVENMVDGVVMTFVDITKRKLAEEERIRASGFAKTILNSINDAISIIDVKGYKIIDCNDALLKGLGMKREAVIGKTCHEIFHHLTDRDQCITKDYLCPIEETLKIGKHSVVEHVHCRKDGKNIHVEVSASPIRNENGEVIQVVHVARDITEYKRKEEEYKKNIEDLKKRLEER